VGGQQRGVDVDDQRPGRLRAERERPGASRRERDGSTSTTSSAKGTRAATSCSACAVSRPRGSADPARRARGSPRAGEGTVRELCAGVREPVVQQRVQPGTGRGRQDVESGAAEVLGRGGEGDGGARGGRFGDDDGAQRRGLAGQGRESRVVGQGRQQRTAQGGAALGEDGIGEPGGRLERRRGRSAARATPARRRGDRPPEGRRGCAA